MYKYTFNTENELDEILESNKESHLISIKRFETYGIVTFSDNITLDEIVQEQGKKISILECENKALREELTQIQTSIDSLTSLIAATLEEK